VRRCEGAETQCAVREEVPRVTKGPPSPREHEVVGETADLDDDERPQCCPPIESGSRGKSPRSARLRCRRLGAR
jgi:hypothetical protein